MAINESVNLKLEFEYWLSNKTNKEYTDNTKRNYISYIESGCSYLISKAEKNNINFKIEKYNFFEFTSAKTVKEIAARMIFSESDWEDINKIICKKYKNKRLEEKLAQSEQYAFVQFHPSYFL